MVASRARPGHAGVRRTVSIPFIAGQWSLRMRAPPTSRSSWRFQSPSLRGSGRFLYVANYQLDVISGFNPLHCGAVVASLGADLAESRAAAFQSPSLRGSGRFWRRCSRPCWCSRTFQSPSLRGSGRFSDADGIVSRLRKFQSPSLRGSGRFERARAEARARRDVSIPFIAGQWSLRMPLAARRVGKEEVSIPFIAGQWSLLRVHPGVYMVVQVVSIPFIAGQWSLHAVSNEPALQGVRLFQSPSLRGSGRFRGGPLPPCHTFQSPSLRGSGRFSNPWSPSSPRAITFQSPSLRGSGRFPVARRGVRDPRAAVSIPFIAGQWSLPEIHDDALQNG